MKLKFESYAVLGIKCEGLEDRLHPEWNASMPVFPNGEFGESMLFAEPSHQLRYSEKLMGTDERERLVGYVLARTDHHNITEIPAVTPSLRRQLTSDLRRAGFSFDDDAIRLYLHQDSEHYEHVHT